MRAAIDWYDSGLSAGDGLSAGEIIGHFFEAVGAGAALLTIIHLIGLFITIIYVAFCKKKNNKKKGKYYYNSQ